MNFTIYIRANGFSYTATSPSLSSILRSWLYFSTRSERQGAPVLICPALYATAISAMIESAVSQERCEMIVRYPAFFAREIASNASVRVPI